MFDNQAFAITLRQYRKSKGLTQKALADALAISPQSVSKWESGASLPDVENLYRLAVLLEVSTDKLLAVPKVQEKAMLGIDGGGTKTEFVLFTEQGVILKRIVLGGSNPNAVGIDGCESVLRQGIETMFAIRDNICGIQIGVAGFSTGDYQEAIQARLQKSYPHTRIECTPDIMNVIAGAAVQGDCVAAICGTGFIVYAKKGDHLQRFGGWGHLLESGGSGYDIGRAALRTALADLEGIGPHSLITPLVEMKLGTSVWERIHEIYAKEPAYVASFAPLVPEAYARGDECAAAILEENTDRMASLIAHAAKQGGNTVVLAGKVIAANTIISDMFKQKLPPELSVVIAERPPVYGACVACCRMCGVDPAVLKGV